MDKRPSNINVYSAVLVKKFSGIHIRNINFVDETQVELYITQNIICTQLHSELESFVIFYYLPSENCIINFVELFSPNKSILYLQD